MFVFALEMLVNDDTIKTFEVNTCNNPKLAYANEYVFTLVAKEKTKHAKETGYDK
jgi:hypothetical protein